MGSRRFTSFGLGKSGVKTFDEALEAAEAGISNANLDRLTQRTLLGQLRSRQANIRLIGNELKGTVFDPKIKLRIQETTGFNVAEDILLR